MPSLSSIIVQGVPLVSQLVSITPRVNIGVFHKDLVRTLPPNTPYSLFKFKYNPTNAHFTNLCLR